DPATPNQQPPGPPAANIQVARVGRGDADNQAITAFEARRNGAGDVEVFARVRNFGDQPASGVLRVRVDGQAFEEQPINLGPQQTQELFFSEFPPNASLIEATFSRNDLLLLDNVAAAAVPVPPL